MSRMPKLEQVLSGIKRSQAWSTNRIKDMMSIAVEVLKTLYGNWQSKASRDSGMLLAAAFLCFFGFFRSGKLTIPMEGGYEADVHLGVQDLGDAAIQMLERWRSDAYRSYMKTPSAQLARY